MKPTSRLYNTLLPLLNQMPWKDFRHHSTFAWMIVGLINSAKIHLSEWVAPVVSRAEQAQSVERRFRRWLSNVRINPQLLYKSLIRNNLKQWNNKKIYLALDTSMLWNTFCVIRLVIIYRGRAIPLAWKVIFHKSSTVKLSVYQELIVQAKELLPRNCKVIFLADRGFADTKLMQFMSETLWHWRIRLKKGFQAKVFFKNICLKIKIFSQTQNEKFKLQTLRAYRGEARFYHN